MKERIYIKIAAMRRNGLNIEDAKHIVLAADTIDQIRPYTFLRGHEGPDFKPITEDCYQIYLKGFGPDRTLIVSEMTGTNIINWYLEPEPVVGQWEDPEDPE
jgi:hypothetical protein